VQASIIAERLVLTGILAIVLLYVGDYGWARYKMSGPNSAAALGSVEVHKIWEVPHKDGREEFSFDPPQTEACLHSIFPHFGYTPCWYAVRHTTQEQ
jgi:hypothetical protein